MINRRTAIRQLFVYAGGLMIATSCSTSGGSASIVLNNMVFSAKEEALIAALVGAIIPASDSPGGVELKLHLFVMKMLDDCHSEADQRAFKLGLEQVQAIPFEDQAKLLKYLEGLPQEDLFLQVLKRRTIQGYLNSAYVMQNKLIYELVPGRYDGAVKVKV